MRNHQRTESDTRDDRGSGVATDHEPLRENPSHHVLHLHEGQDISKGKAGKNDERRLTLDAEEKILALYDEYRPRLFRYIRSMQLRSDLAEEVIQETFMRLTTELISDHGIENMRGWIVRVAHNLAVNLLKREQSAVLTTDVSAFLIENHVDPGPGPDETYSENERVKQMKSALALLKPKHRQCFEMRAQGFPYKDISLALGISEQRAAFVVKQVAVRLASICG